LRERVRREMKRKIEGRNDNITHTHGYPSISSQFWLEKFELTRFEFRFGFSLFLKHEGGTGSEDINIHPKSILEPAPLISNYILSLLN
jgi:hypothetical protein